MGRQSGRSALMALLLAVFVAVFVIVPAAEHFVCSDNLAQQAAAMSAALDQHQPPDLDNDCKACLHCHCHHLSPAIPQESDVVVEPTEKAAKLAFMASESLSSRAPNGLMRPPRA